MMIILSKDHVSLASQNEMKIFPIFWSTSRSSQVLTQFFLQKKCIHVFLIIFKRASSFPYIFFKSGEVDRKQIFVREDVNYPLI